MLFTASAAASVPAAYQVRNFSDALIGSSVALDDRNNLIKQINFDRVFHARLVLLNQRSSEFIKMLEDRAQCSSRAARSSLPKEQSTCALRASHPSPLSATFCFARHIASPLTLFQIFGSAMFSARCF
jgi:uracil DNA glycosylase